MRRQRRRRGSCRCGRRSIREFSAFQPFQTRFAYRSFLWAASPAHPNIGNSISTRLPSMIKTQSCFHLADFTKNWTAQAKGGSSSRQACGSCRHHRNRWRYVHALYGSSLVSIQRLCMAWIACARVCMCVRPHADLRNQSNETHLALLHMGGESISLCFAALRAT